MLTGESELKKDFEKEREALSTLLADFEKRIRELEQRPLCPCKRKDECKRRRVGEKSKKEQMTPQPWPMPPSHYTRIQRAIPSKAAIQSATKEKENKEEAVSPSSMPQEEATEREERRVADAEEALKEGLPLDEVVKMEQEEDNAREHVEGTVKNDDIGRQIDSSPQNEGWSGEEEKECQGLGAMQGEDAMLSNGDDTMEGMLEKNHAENTQETVAIGCQKNSTPEKKEEEEMESEGEQCDACNSVHPEDSKWCNLFDAIRHDDVSAVCAFIRRGANLDERQGNWTPLGLAALLGREEIVAELLRAGANTATPGASSPLHAAVGVGNAAMVQLLLEHGTDVNFRDINGNTALHRAVNFGSEDIVRLLLKRGADPFAKNWGGMTALDYAEGLQNAEIVAVLEEHPPSAGAASS